MCSYFQQEQAQAKSQRYVENTERQEHAETRVIRPSVAATTITAEGEQDRHWGLVPLWSKVPKLKYSTFNARAESLTEKHAYRDAWKHSQRCLIPAVSYSEWVTKDGKKVRHDIAPADGSELMIAGLWSDWWQGDESRPSFTMVTTAPLEQIEWVHNRSPRMLLPDEQDTWLHGAPDECLDLLLPRDPGALVVEPATG